MANLDPQLQSSIDNLQTRHTALVDAVRNYSGGSVAESTSDLIAAKNDVMTAVDTRESALLGLIQRDTTKPVPSLLSDFKTQTYMLGTRRLEHGVSVHEMWDIQRASSKWVFGPQGKLVEVPANDPVYEYDPTSGESLGLLVEGSATNLITDSPLATGPLSPSPTPSPIGGTSYSSATAAEDGDSISILETINIVGGGDIVTSVIVSDNTTVGALLFNVDNTSGDSQRVVVDLADGTVGSGSSNASDFDVFVTPIAGGRRISVRLNSYDGPNRVGFIAKNSPSSVSYRSDLTAGDVVELTCFQVEEGTHPTSYIPTVDAPVTRAEDIVYRNIGDELNPAVGTFLIDHGGIHLDGNSMFFSAYGSNNNYMSLGYSTRLAGYFPPFFPSLSASINYAKGKIAITYEVVAADTVRCVIVDNGVTIHDETGTGDTSVIADWDRIYLGRRNGSGFVTQSSTFSSVAYYPYALTETELQELTQ